MKKFAAFIDASIRGVKEGADLESFLLFMVHRGCPDVNRVRLLALVAKEAAATAVSVNVEGVAAEAPDHYKGH